jgi:uncharacterized membrane protein YdfJ with MMPL/SSD domain
MLSALSTRIHAHHRLVLGAWLVAVVASAPFAARQSSHLTAGAAAAAGSQSARVEAALLHHFPAISAEHAYVLMSPAKGASGEEMMSEIQRVARAVRDSPHVTLAREDRETALLAAGRVSPLLIPLQVAGARGEALAADSRLLDTLAASRPASHRVAAYLIGEGALWTGLQRTIKQDLTKAEVFGFPALLALLLVIFGSLGAAMLPILLGVGTLLVTGLGIYLLSMVMTLSIFVTDTAALIGIGVAIDYSLIILSRIRQELAGGRDLADAQRVALMTSGRTVLFSGATVTLSMCGLLLIPGQTLRSLTIGAILAVCVAVVMAVTMLPALVWMLGARRVCANAIHVHLSKIARRAQLSALNWSNWTRVVTRRPALTALGATVVLLVLAVPAHSIRTSTGALRELADHNETRVGFEEAARILGAGTLGPIFVLARGDVESDGKRLARLREQIGGLEHVRLLGPIETSSDRRYAVFAVIPSVDPESPAAKQLVGSARRLAAANEAGDGLTLEVGGWPAIQTDQEAEIVHNLWKAVLAILLISFAILAVLLRSLVLPLKAVVMNLLAVGAGYGVLVAVFQWGWANAVLGTHTDGYLETLSPPLVLAIVFGLSMDYEIFLLSRIREQWNATGRAREAVAAGLSVSARTISNAALMLIGVFVLFVVTGVQSVKEIGLGGAVAIGVDVTVIRLVLVPALMTLLGHWNWWWPRPLSTLWPAGAATAGAGGAAALGGSTVDAAPSHIDAVV